jgi:hypothetical protein
VLASIEARAPAPDPKQPAEGKIIRPASGAWRLVPWTVAAGFAVLAGWFAHRDSLRSGEMALLRDQQALTAVELQSVRNHLEAERIVTQRQIATLGRQAADHTRQLDEAQQKNSSTLRDLADAQQKLAETTRALAAAQDRANGLDRLLADARTQIAGLNRDMQAQSDLANLKITTLASMLNNSPQAIAVAVWNPAKQEGTLQVTGLPALGPDEDYQLWVVDPQYADPVDGGVFTVEPASGTRRVNFRAKQPVRAIDAFAVTKERKGGVQKSAGPFVLLGK